VTKNQSVVLFAPKACSPFKRFIRIPYALLSISSILDQEGYKINIVDATNLKSYKKVCSNALCLGVNSIIGPQISDELKISRQVKEEFSDIKVVWGGAHPTALPEQTLSNENIDIIVKGQGELTFTHLVHTLEQGRPLNDVDGIYYKDNGKIIKTPERPISNPNKFPPYPFHLIDLKKHVMKVDGFRCANYVSSRGCSFNCKFCSIPIIYKRHWFGLNPKRVINDLLYLKEKGKVEYIWFDDANYFADWDRAKEISKLMIQQDLQLKWFAEARADKITRLSKDDIVLLKESGLYRLFIGAESGSQRILNTLQKGTTVKDILDFAKICIENDIGAIFSFMVGLPHETIYDFYKTLSLIEKITTMSDSFTIMLQLYASLPSTALYEDALKMGFREPKTVEEWSEIDFYHFNTPWVSKKLKKIIATTKFQIIPLLCFKDSSKINGRKFIPKILYKIPYKISLFRLRNLTTKLSQIYHFD